MTYRAASDFFRHWCRRRSKVGCDVLQLPSCICLQVCIVRTAGERSRIVREVCAIGSRNVLSVRANGDSGRSVELVPFRVAGSSRLPNRLSSGNRVVGKVVWLFAAWSSLQLNSFLFDVSCRAFNLDTEFNSFENHGNGFFAQVFAFQGFCAFGLQHSAEVYLKSRHLVRFAFGVLFVRLRTEIIKDGGATFPIKLFCPANYCFAAFVDFRRDVIKVSVVGFEPNSERLVSKR